MGVGDPLREQGSEKETKRKDIGSCGEMETVDAEEEAGRSGGRETACATRMGRLGRRIPLRERPSVRTCVGRWIAVPFESWNEAPTRPRRIHTSFETRTMQAQRQDATSDANGSSEQQNVRWDRIKWERQGHDDRRLPLTERNSLLQIRKRDGRVNPLRIDLLASSATPAVQQHVGNVRSFGM